MNKIKKLELKAICEIQRKTELRKKRAQFNMMRTLNRLNLVSDNFLSTEYYMRIMRCVR